MINIDLFDRKSPMNAVDNYFDIFTDIGLIYLASDLMNYGIRSPMEINTAVRKAMQICETAKIPIFKNFKPIYVCKDGQILSDWKLSLLGKKLALLNANPRNKFVAQLQLKLLNNF